MHRGDSLSLALQGRLMWSQCPTQFFSKRRRMRGWRSSVITSSGRRATVRRWRKEGLRWIRKTPSLSGWPCLEMTETNSFLFSLLLLLAFFLPPPPPLPPPTPSSPLLWPPFHYITFQIALNWSGVFLTQEVILYFCFFIFPSSSRLYLGYQWKSVFEPPGGH